MHNQESFDACPLTEKSLIVCLVRVSGTQKWESACI